MKFTITQRVGASIAAAALAGLTLSGCSTSDEPSSDGQTLTLGWQSPEKLGVDAVIAEFEKQNPGVTVNARMANTTDYQAQLRTELSSGTAPDVIAAWPGNGNGGALRQLVPDGYLEDLSDEAWVSSLPSAYEDYLKVDGKAYMVPMSQYIIGMIFNMDTMEANGFKPPTTYSEVLQLCKDASAKDLIAFDNANSELFAFMTPYALAATNVYATEPDIDARMADGEQTFAGSPGYQKTMDQDLEMFNAGCFGPNATGATFADSVSNIASGKSLGAVNITGVIGQFQEAAPDATFQLFPLPATDDPDETYLTLGAGDGGAITADSKNKELAKKFLAFLAEPATQVIFAEATGSIPAITGSDYQPSELVQPVLDYFDNGKNGPLLDQNWPNSGVQQAMVAGVQGLLGGSATATQALTMMDQAYTGK